MRKVFFTGFFLLILTLCFAALSAASIPVKIRVNGIVIMPDTAPVVVDGRTLVPVRFVAEALGASVNWDDGTSTVIINTGGTPYSPPEKGTGEIRILVNGQLIYPDVPPASVNGRVMVPIRFIAEALDCRVGWNERTNTVLVTDKKNTTDHANILPASGVKQEAVDIVKEYAEKVYSQVGANFEPLQGKYDIYIYPDRNSYQNGGVELRKISWEEAGKGTVFWQSPNIIGIDISNLGPDTGNWLAWAFTSLNIRNIGGSKVPNWINEGMAYYQCYSDSFNSLATEKTLANDRMLALDASVKESINKLSEAPDLMKFSYKYRYANYMAAKILVDSMGFPKINDLLGGFKNSQDVLSFFRENTGYSPEEFDYQLTKTLYSDSKQGLKRSSVKVSIAEKGCTDKTYVLVGTTFMGKNRFYQLKVGKTPGDYFFSINPDGSVSSDYGQLKEVELLLNKQPDYDASVSVVYPGSDIQQDWLNIEMSYGVLYPNNKKVVKNDLTVVRDLSQNLDQDFPDGNKIILE